MDIDDLRRIYEIVKEGRRGTADEVKIHSKQEFRAMSEWLDKKPKPEHLGSIDTGLYSIPIYTDENVPPGVLRLMRDGKTLKDVVIR